MFPCGGYMQKTDPFDFVTVIGVYTYWYVYFVLLTVNALHQSFSQIMLVFFCFLEFFNMPTCCYKFL